MHLVHFSSEYSNVLEASTKPGGLVVLSVLFQIAEVSCEGNSWCFHEMMMIRYTTFHLPMTFL